VATTAGNYKCVITNAFGCTKVSQTKTVIINCRLSGSGSSDISYLTSPNPFSRAFTLNFNEASDHNTNIKVYDLIGKQVALYQHIDTKNSFTAGEELQPGMFIIEVSQGDERQIIRIVKK